MKWYKWCQTDRQTDVQTSVAHYDRLTTLLINDIRLFEGPSLLCLEEPKLHDDEAPRLKQHTTTVSNRSHTASASPVGTWWWW